MRLSITALLAGTALTGLGVPGAAWAQQAETTTAPPAEEKAATDAATDQDQEDIVVLGFGQSRQVQTVTAVDIARLAPGSSPLKAIEKLPGVNFQSSDPFGAYEWAVRISLRGFNQNQLGFTLDDIPLGDMSYGNVNGLHISRAIISENVARTEVAQGAGALGTASTSNLGGTIQFYSANPTDTANVTGSGTYGSDNTWRGYVRLDSGEIYDGIKGYVSYAQYKTDKWKGYGEQRQKQANAKLMADLGAAGSISLFFDWSQRREQDYQDLSYDIIRRRGLNDDNIANNYPLALQIATAYQTGTAFPAGFGTVDDAYYDAAGLRDDYLGGATFNAHLLDGLNVKTTGYYHENKGQGSWITPYTATPLGAPNSDGTPIGNPAPVSYRTTEYRMHRGGAISTLTYETGINTFEVGGWYEYNDFNTARRFYGMATGTQPNRLALEFQSNPFYTQWNGNYDTSTIQYHVEDTLKLLGGDLVVNAGWKGLRVINTARLVTGTLAQGRIQARDWFQPKVSALFHLGNSTELFADYTENMRAFVGSGAGGPFSTTQVGFNAIRNTLKPERSKTAEGGIRFRSGPLQVSGVGYYVDFSNRLLAFQNGAGIVGNPSILNNVGSVETYGGEFSVNFKLMRVLSLFGSYSYTHSRYQDNVVNAAGTILAPTKDKAVVDTPENMLKGELVYEQYGVTARIGADYMSRRYFTYLNDQSVPSRLLLDASIGYNFVSDGFLHGFSIVGSVVNLTDKKYIATIGSNGYTASGDNQTLLAGSPRQFFISVKKGF